MNESPTWKDAQTGERQYWDSAVKALEGRAKLLTDLAYYSTVFDFATEEVKQKKPRNALEVGIGPYGIGSAVFLSDELAVRGIDPLGKIEFHCNDSQLDHYAHSFCNRVEYQQVKGEKLPFGDASYDLVASANVIDHCERPMKVLEEMHRVLKPGGLFLLAVNSFSVAGRFKFESWRKIQPSKPIFVMHPFSFLHSDLRRMLAKNLGLRILSEQGAPKKYFGSSTLSRFLAEKLR